MKSKLFLLGLAATALLLWGKCEQEEHRNRPAPVSSEIIERANRAIIRIEKVLDQLEK